MKTHVLVSRQALRLARLALLTAWLLSLCACACLRTAQKSAVAEKCTSISNIVDKNYKIGARFQYLLVGAGVNVERSGVALTQDAANRQIEMDRLCRMWATGGIDNAKWAEVYQNYIIASASAAARVTRPDLSTSISKEITDNLENIQTIVEELARGRNNTAGDAPLAIPPPDKLLAKIQETAQLSDKAIIEKMDEVAQSVGKQLSTANDELIREYRRTAIENGLQLASLHSLVSNLTSRIEILGTGGKQPDTKLGSAFYLKFGLGSSMLTTEAKNLLRQNLAYLSGASVYHVDLVGYTDRSGKDAVNAALSLARAERVRDFLIDNLALTPSNVSVYGRASGGITFGPDDENRRVAVRVTMH